ncbi:hypothetical protein Tco_0416994 [Tanacetum coccineum]
MTKNKEIYVTPSHTKNVFSNMKREGKGFSGRVTPLFQTMMVQAPKELGDGLEIPTDPEHTPSKTITDEAANEEHVPIHSNDPLLSGEDRLKLNELMELCTNLSQKVLNLENTKTSQAAKIAKLKEMVKKLERRNKSRTPRLKRLWKRLPLATKSPIIVDWKIIKEGKMGYFQIIRADGSSRRTEEAYERVLWGDLKVMFEPDVESEVWRNLQGYNVIVWKLFSSSGVHFAVIVDGRDGIQMSIFVLVYSRFLRNVVWSASDFVLYSNKDLMGMASNRGFFKSEIENVSTKSRRHGPLPSGRISSRAAGRSSSEVINHKVEFKRISLTGFRSCTSRSRYRSVSKQTTRFHIESRKSPTKSLFDVGSRRISIFTVNTKEYHSDVLAIITRIMRRT